MHRSLTNLLMKGWLIASAFIIISLFASPTQAIDLTAGSLAGSTLEHQINLNDPDANGDDTITIVYTVPQTSWVAIGVNPTGGGMVNGEVIIAKPEDDTILKYRMTAKAPNAITELPNQTLINPSLEQTDGSTILTFTKRLVEEGEYTITAGEENIFIAGFGSSNTFGYHQFRGVQDVMLDQGMDAPGDADAITEAPGADPTVAPVIPGTDPTVAPVVPGAPTVAPVVPDTPTDAPVVPSTPAPVPTALNFEQVPLSGKLETASFRYSVTRGDANANGADTITVEFTCPGNVWVGTGVSQYGGMTPGKSVIGFPGGESPPAQYSMVDKAVEGVTPLPADQQTLIGSSITVANDVTTLLYTQPLDEADDIFAIKSDGETTTNFIGACGTSAGPSFHQFYGGFGVTVKDTAPAAEAGFRSVPLAGLLATADFQYRLNRNDEMAGGDDTVTIEYSCPGNVWVGVGVSEFGGMVPARGVWGFPESGNPPNRVSMEAKEVPGVNPLPAEEQNLIDPQITFANDRTTLRYTIPTAKVETEKMEIHADGRTNNFIGACGTAAGPSFHQLYGGFGVVVEEGATEAPTVAAPFAAPTNPPGFEVLELSGDLEGSTLSYAIASNPAVDGKGTITVTYTAPVNGWVSVGTSESGLMVGSEAVIGIPATGEVKKYTLASKSGDLSGVQPMPDEKQTLVGAAIAQANGMTTLTYTKILVEDGEIPINAVGENIFIAAQGSSNNLGFHASRGAFSLSGKEIKRDNSLWVVHGWLAAIAWAVLCPLAILAGLFRKFIPGAGMWYTIHRTLQGLVVLLTIASVAVAIAALDKETPENSDANHFSVDFVDGHRLIGLVVLIAAIVQGANGAMRPHLPPKPEENAGGDNEEGKGSTPPPEPAEKSGARKAWEVLHRLLGVGLLALTWYQIYLGIIWYNDFFADGEEEAPETVFYAVIGILGALIVIGVAMRLLCG